MSAGGPLQLCSSSSEYREEGGGGNGVENPSSSTTGSPLPQLWQWLQLAELKLLEVEGWGGHHPQPSQEGPPYPQPLPEHVMAAVHSPCPL